MADPAIVAKRAEDFGFESSKPGCPGLGTSQVPSSAQTACHFASIPFGSYPAMAVIL